MKDRIEKTAPSRSTNTFADIKQYIFRKPPVETLVDHEKDDSRGDLGKSILQRTGINVDNYKMLNIHRVGIEAPASYVFDELMQWSGDAICWPNHIAKVSLQDDKLEHIKIYLLGINIRFLGLNLFHLFDLSAIRIQRIPSDSDFDNARYLLYECKGGYPIGIFSMYVRTSIPDRKEEKEMSQLFMMVSFDFYGRQRMRLKLLNRLWEKIHNRVTSNMVYRFKELCEWKFESFVNEKKDIPAS